MSDQVKIDLLIAALERLAAVADKLIPSDDASNWELHDAEEAILQAHRAIVAVKGE